MAKGRNQCCSQQCSGQPVTFMCWPGSNSRQLHCFPTYKATGGERGMSGVKLHTLVTDIVLLHMNFVQFFFIELFYIIVCAEGVTTSAFFIMRPSMSNSGIIR